MNCRRKKTLCCCCCLSAFSKFILCRHTPTPHPNFLDLLFTLVRCTVSPRVYVFERTILLVVYTLNFCTSNLQVIESSVFVSPLHFSQDFSTQFVISIFIQCILDISHNFSHQKLMPYGRDSTFGFSNVFFFFFSFRLTAAYHWIYLLTNSPPADH